jgi:hypothetical protein
MPLACPLESVGLVSANKVRKFLTRHHREDTRLSSACVISGVPLVQSQLVECGQEGMVCSHALLGGDRVWLAQSLSPAG